MNNDLIINGKSAFNHGSVFMGEGFVDALCLPPDPKPYVENKSRLDNGKSVVVRDAKVDSREVTLTFNLHAVSPQELVALRNEVITTFSNGYTKIKVPSISADTYRLIYKKSISYASNKRHTICRLTVKFDEPNPARRSY